jgi:16S rRNA (guanine527-N7)-methyltransferase
VCPESRLLRRRLSQHVFGGAESQNALNDGIADNTRMSTGRLSAALAAGLERAAIDVPGETRDALFTYLTLLARWNRKINLTAFDLDMAEDRAIDRLVIEPLRAATLFRGTDRELLDIGSGGGSPAVPMAVCGRHLRVTMVEVRERKAAFLREVVRTLGLDAAVECRRFEEVAAGWPSTRPIDLITCRAVRGGAALAAGMDRVLGPSGRILWFGEIGHITDSFECDSASSGGLTGLKVLLRRT